MAINVNREVEDAFYRYKMPKLAAKVEGKGNGIKTVIVNVGDIAKSLCRNPMYVTKFFGFELGAQIHVDGKNERYIVNGAHDATKLQELLDGFIKKFVLCESCGNPETTMCVNKRAGTVATTCKACGCQGQLDVKHRLTQYIIKSEGDTTVKVKSKKNKKGKNAEKTSDEEQETSIIGDETNRQSPTTTMNDDDDDEWVEDTTEEAQLKRMNELSAMAKSLALSVDVEKSETERADILYKHLKQLINENQILSRAREVYQEADRLNLGSRAVLVLAEVLLTSPTEIVADIKKYSPVFVQFTRFGDSQKRSQQYLLGAMCKLIERHSDASLINKACHMLKAFYDCDIIEEDTILEWNDKGPSKKFVSKELCANILTNCAPMINWLKEAEEETDESEEETEHIQPIISQAHENESKFIPDAQTNGSKYSESEDDIDIDAI